MKKQTFNLAGRLLILSFSILMLGPTAVELHAQGIIRSHLKDITIPNDEREIYIELKGGDGGKNNHAKGGRGVTIKGTLEIGTEPQMIAPGGTLRFITGKAGASTNSKAGGGGGATGLIYRPPGTLNWKILAVAAGGGGASIKVTTDPVNVKTGRDGGQGKTSISDMADDPYHFGYMGGSRIISHEDGGCGGRQGMVDGVPTVAKVDSDCSMPGGSGFGSGGSGYEDPSNTAVRFEWWGGGGGGYLGGYFSKDGSSTQYENGGGSWSKYPSQLKVYANGTTSSPEDGYAIYGYFEQIKFAYNTGKCIDDYASHTDNGTNVQTYNCHSAANQWWLFDPADRSVRSMLNINKCLDLDHSNVNNGTNIQLWDCNGTSAQGWLYNGIHKTIHSGASHKKCLDATNGAVDPNANVNVQLYDCQYGHPNMRWEIAGATTVSDPAKVKYIVPVIFGGFAVHSHSGAKVNSNIQLWTKDNTNEYEQWYFDGLAIKMRNHQDLCIDLYHSDVANGTNIQLYTCNGSYAQQWIYDGLTGTIRSAINQDKCMQYEQNSGGEYGNYSNVQIWDCNGSQRQHFLIRE